MILDPLETVLLWILISFYSLTLLIAWRVSESSTKGRKKSLSSLFILNLVLFYSSLIAIHLVLGEWEPDFIEFVTAHSLLIIGTYIATIEVPGFLILSHYDELSIETMRTVKEHLIKCTYSFAPSIVNLKELLNKHKSRLEELTLFTNLEYFVRSSSQSKQVNRSVFDLLLAEVGQMARSVSQKSKHPFPKLIDVLSLSGLSFLIAHLLK